MIRSAPGKTVTQSIITCYPNCKIVSKLINIFIKKVEFSLLSAFGSSYNCEQISSQMKYILNKNRTSLTIEHSDECIQLKMIKYKSDLSKLASTVQHHGSH